MLCKLQSSSLIGQCAGHVTRFLKSYAFKNHDIDQKTIRFKQKFHWVIFLKILVADCFLDKFRECTWGVFWKARIITQLIAFDSNYFDIYFFFQHYHWNESNIWLKKTGTIRSSNTLLRNFPMLLNQTLIFHSEWKKSSYFQNDFSWI